MHFNRAVPATILTLNERSLAAIYFVINQVSAQLWKIIINSKILIISLIEITNDTLFFVN